MPPRIGLPATFFLCVFDAVFEKSFLEPLEDMRLRFMGFSFFGVMGHIEIKEIQYAPCVCQASLDGASGAGL